MSKAASPHGESVPVARSANLGANAQKVNLVEEG